jgi:hypothetical protein
MAHQSDASEKLRRGATYPVGDYVTREERAALSIDLSKLAWPEVRAEWTGEKRAPKAGEWYLSGAVITAYRAPNDLSIPYHIACLVRVQKHTVETVTHRLTGE